jgi:signal transduction histidine kinase
VRARRVPRTLAAVQALQADSPAQAAERIQQILRGLRTTLDADWAVVWGPIPLARDLPFTFVLFEDRDPSVVTALGLAVPVLGNPWAEHIMREGAAVTSDARNDPRLAIHRAVIEENRVCALASAADMHGDRVRAVVEVYARGALRDVHTVVPVLREAGRAIADTVEGLPQRENAASRAPEMDPLTSAALHDLKNVLAAQSLLVSSMERELRSAASEEPHAARHRASSLLDTLSVLRESVLHAGEIARVMTLGSAQNAQSMRMDLPALAQLSLAVVPLDLRPRFALHIAEDLAMLSPVRDAPSLMRALVNLVQNAARSIQPREHARCTVSVRADAPDVLVDVEDQGAGVPPEMLARLFEAGATDRRGEGHGFGLFSSRTMVESMGGTLTLYSVPGKGARFTIRLPRAAFR